MPEGVPMSGLLTALTMGLTLLSGPAPMADGVATRQEARSMAVKAAAYLAANGADKAFLAFAAKGPPWHDRDLYVTVLDSKGIAVVRGNSPDLSGKSMVALKDADGEAFISEMVPVADVGWVSFKWQNPETKAVEPKVAYEIRVGGYIVGVGANAQ